MKFHALSLSAISNQSLPTRGAWIEIKAVDPSLKLDSGRSPHGERGLKSAVGKKPAAGYGRSPHGERGLKYLYLALLVLSQRVAPHTGSVD